MAENISLNERADALERKMSQYSDPVIPAQEIRVTTSEEVFRTHGSFFRSAGFKELDWEVHRYRRDVSEIVWKMDIDPASWMETKNVDYLRDSSRDTCAILTTPILVGIFEQPHNSIVAGVMEQSNRNSCARLNVESGGNLSLLGSTQSEPIYILYSTNWDQQPLTPCSTHENIKNSKPTQTSHDRISDSKGPVTVYKNALIQTCIMSYGVNWSLTSASPHISFKPESKGTT